MSIESTNSGWYIYIGAAVASDPNSLPAFNSDTFTEVPEAMEIEGPDYEKTVSSYYVLNDQNPRVVTGRLKEQKCSGMMVQDLSKAPHVAMRSDVRTAGGAFRNWKVVTQSGRVKMFKGAVVSYKEAKANSADDAKELDVNWEIAVTGGVTEA